MYSVDDPMIRTSGHHDVFDELENILE